MIYYKFFSFGHGNSTRRKWTMDVFQNNRLYIGEYSKLNDPMEAIYNATYLTPQMREEIFHQKQRIMIGCLTKTYTDILMWSHYADGHKGCCVELEVLPEDERRINRVSYVDQIVEPQGNTIMDKCHDILMKKLQAWNYEQEYRCLKLIDVNDHNSQFISIRINKVFLGQKLSIRQVAHFKKLIRSHNPELDVEQIRLEDLTWYNGENIYVLEGFE